jgi:uncharacterized membrane protein HdeD (DUF308 family)
MMKQERVRFKTAWILLAITGVAILVFGLIIAVWPDATNRLFFQAIGAASIGMGLFGTLIAVIPFRRRERWAWFTLWYYPIFWLAHFLGGLPPGQDHIHQIVLIVFSLAALLVSASEFFPRRLGQPT